jgi:hypothetical protein
MKSNIHLKEVLVLLCTLLLAGFTTTTVAQNQMQSGQQLTYPVFLNTGSNGADKAKYLEDIEKYQAAKEAIINSTAYKNARSEFNATKLNLMQIPMVTPQYSVNTLTGNCIIPRDNTWIEVPRNDDGTLGPIALGFTFYLYGASYTSAYLNTNGNFTFGGPLGTYSPNGFPDQIPMVAPFWSDVDTRNMSCEPIFYKLYTDSIIVLFENVGYFNQHCDLVSTFEVVLRAGTGSGNVSFYYGDMNWTTGDASNGVGGFGGYAATVGIDKGNGVDFVQIGRFSVNSSVYDGPGGNEDGVHYLDNKCYTFSVAGLATNVPPVYTSVPAGQVLVTLGATTTINLSAIGPEVGQNVTLSLNANGLCGVVPTIVNGANATMQIDVTGMACNLGVHPLVIKAVDNGLPNDSTIITIYVNVTTSNCPPATIALTAGGLNALWVNAGASNPNTFYYGVTNALRVNATIVGGVGPYTYVWSSTGGASTLMPRAYYPPTSIDLFEPTGPVTVTLTITDQNNCTYSGSINMGWSDEFFCNHLNYKPWTWYLNMCRGGQDTCMTWADARIALRANPPTATLGSCNNVPAKTDLVSNVTSFSVYPNPSSGLFILEMPIAANTSGTVTVMDVNGRALYAERLTMQEGMLYHSIDLGALPNGIYVVRVATENEFATERIQIIR